jgi:hypothetical protein
MKLIKNPELTKKNFVTKDANESDLILTKNKQELNIKFLTEIHFILTKIIIRKLEQEVTGDYKRIKTSIKTDITFLDFIEEICYFSNSNINLKEKFNNKINMELEITISKLKLGERFVEAFEIENVIKNE